MNGDGQKLQRSSRSPLARRLLSEHDTILRAVQQRVIEGMPSMAALPEFSKKLWMMSAQEAIERGLRRWAGREAPDDEDRDIYVALAEDAVQNVIPPQNILHALETGCSVLIASYWSLAHTGDYSDLADYTAWKHDQTEVSLKILSSAYHDAVRQAGRDELAKRAYMQSLLVGEPSSELASAAGIKPAEAYVVLVLPTTQVQKSMLSSDALLHALDRVHTAVFLPCEDSPESWIACEATATRYAILNGINRVVLLARAPSPALIPTTLAWIKRSISLGATLRLSGVVRPETLRVEQLLLRDTDLRADLADVLSPLVNQVDLIATLEQLYRNDLDRGRCAARLGIHRRTLAYRLEKVAALTGIDPLSGPGIKTFQLALAAYYLTTTEYAEPKESTAPNNLPVFEAMPARDYR